MFHAEASSTWNSHSLAYQMANIGAEVGRALKWKEKGKLQISENAAYRALELIDLTKSDPKNKRVLKEICRVREVFLDHVFGDNLYNSSPQHWDKYFYFFTLVARGK